jgi:hypothetical protein
LQAISVVLMSRKLYGVFFKGLSISSPPLQLLPPEDLEMVPIEIINISLKLSSFAIYCILKTARYLFNLY